MGKSARRLNISSTLYLVTFLLVSATLFSVKYIQIVKDSNCSTAAHNSTRLWTAFSIGMMASEGLLLLCMIYPLWLHNRIIEKFGLRQKSIFSVFKRCVVAGMACVFSEAVLAICTLAYSEQPADIRRNLFDNNRLVSVAALQYTFSDWKERLLPFFRKQPHQKSLKCVKHLLCQKCNLSSSELVEKVWTQQLFFHFASKLCDYDGDLYNDFC